MIINGIIKHILINVNSKYNKFKISENAQEVIFY